MSYYPASKLVLFVIVALSASSDCAATGDVAAVPLTGPAQELPAVHIERLEDAPPSAVLAYAMQSAATGGSLREEAALSTGTAAASYVQVLTLRGVGESVAMLPDPSSSATSGLVMGPHAMLAAAPNMFPRFGMLYAVLRNGESADAEEDAGASVSMQTPPKFQVLSLRLLEMRPFDAQQGGQLEYVVEVINANVGGGHTDGNVTAASTKLEFIQGNLLIDLVGINASEHVSEERRAMSLEHMDASGELAYNVKRYDDSLDNGHDPVKAYGLIRTGWLPWWTSPIYWVCCPTSLIVCPLCLPWTIYCCF
jgi:hypothetical protein